MNTRNSALFGLLLLSAAIAVRPAQAQDQTSPNAPQPPVVKRVNPKDGLTYVLIPPGTFMMGCSPGDSNCSDQEKPSHQVTITKGFWLGQTPVTVSAYKRFVAAKGQNMILRPGFNTGKGNDHMPIDSVPWLQAQTYCSWVGGRLPTEAEWEYAARGGSTEARYGNLDDIAWYHGNSGMQTRDVAQKRANGFGLYDMLGNVWEWVSDRYDPNYYPSSPSQDPQGPASGGMYVVRGGSWMVYPGGVRVSNRFGSIVPVAGFRCGEEATQEELRALGSAVTPAAAPQNPKPFTQKQVQSMVRDGLANDLAAKAITTQGIDFTPTDDFLRILQAAGASEAFLQALRTAPHPTTVASAQTPNASANPPLDPFQLLALLASGVPDARIAELVKQRGVTEALHQTVTDYLSQAMSPLKELGATADLIATVRFATVFPNPPADISLVHMRMAREEFQEKVKQNPHNHAARVGLVVATESWDESIAVMRDAVTLEPSDPWAHFMLAEILSASGKDKGAAMEEYRRALQLKANYPGAHLGIANLLFQSHDSDGAIRECREEIRLNPKDSGARAQLVAYLVQTGKLDEGVAAAEEELQLDSKDAATHYWLGRALAADPARQLQEFRRASDLEPDHDEYRLAYQNLLLKQQSDITTGGAASATTSRNPPPASPSVIPGSTRPISGEARENPKDGLKYVWIPPGTFMMGCSPGDDDCDNSEKPSHQVTITRGFWIGQTPATVGAYKRYVGATGRPMPPEPNVWGRAINPGWGNDAMPIVDITWDEAQAYCGWAGGRLPTEAEWAYAARGGSTEARYGTLEEVAWYADNSGLRRLDSDRLWEESKKNVIYYMQQLRDNGNGMKPVGVKQPNRFGLFDMLGNVQEWVGDWFDQNYYQHSPTADPSGPASGQSRVLRGFSWADMPSGDRVSHRYGMNPTTKLFFYGFRCAGELVISAPAPPFQAGTATDQPIVVGGQVQSAKLIFQPRPVYPPLAKMGRVEGVVRLQAIIDKDGTIEDLKVISGHPLLIKAAMDAVEKWRYQQTMLNGEPVKVATQITVNFNLGP